MKKTFFYIATALILLISSLYITGHGYIVTAFTRTWMIGNSTANIDDHTDFKTRLIKTGTSQPWKQHANYNQISLPNDLTQFLDKHDTTAFLVVYKGQILNEHYFQGYHRLSKTNSFSVAKTVLTLLVGAAIKEGHITNFEQPILDFFPEFEKDKYAQQVNLSHLSAMTSGYDWDEDYYSAFSPTVKLLYGENANELVLGRKFYKKPDEEYYYSSASTQLLSIALMRAINKTYPDVTLSDYLSKTLWQPLGMNDDALWHTDNVGSELAFCCINSNARNFAKLGQLMLNHGRWQNEQIIPQDFINDMIQSSKVEHYGYATWLNMNHQPSLYWFTGHLGQYIINIPEKDIVIVRLGHDRPSDTEFITDEVPFLVTQTTKMLKRIENSQ